jgi:segregation and condensation protein A
VVLEAFEGPLDLLLYLIRRQNVDILDIPVAEITRQYTSYIELMQVARLDLAAEYLVMAATLAEIKSRMLLPRSETGATEEEDPRAALVKRLQEYERFRDAARALDERPRLERDIFAARAPFLDSMPVVRLPAVTAEQLAEAFRRVLAEVGRFQHLHVTRETLSVRERMTRILNALSERGFARFEELFDPAEGRMGVVVSFIAILELAKDNMLVIVQNEPFSPLHLKAV